MVAFNPNWAAIAQILGGALAAPDGQYAQGAAQGAQNYQAFQGAQQDQQYRQQQMDMQRQEFDLQKAEYDRQAKADADWRAMLGVPQQAQVGPTRPDQLRGYQTATSQPASPFGDMTPQQRAFMAMAGRDAGIDILGQRLFAQAKDTSTDDMREYELAKSQGYQGSFFDYQNDLRKSSASNTNVNVNMPKSLLAGDQKMLEMGGEAFMQAQEILPLFGIAREAAKSFGQSGPLGGAALFAERAKNYMGMDNNASAGEVLQGMQTRLGTLLRVPGSGATSNYEMALYMQGVPGLMNSQQGNIALADIGEKLIKRRMQDYQRLQAHVAATGSTIGYQPDESPALSDQEIALLQGGGAPEQTQIPTVNTPEEAAKLPSGTVFIDPNGVRRRVP